MKKLRIRFAAALLALSLIAALIFPAAAADDSLIRAAEGTAARIVEDNPSLKPGSIGGEWAAIALLRGGFPLPESYINLYLSEVDEYVKACGGVLHSRKYTEYSRVVLALSAVEANPANVAGYDLTFPLGDYDKTVAQGVNGAVWALLALDAGGWAIPANPGAERQATRQMYVGAILDAQLADGSWSMSGKAPGDPDVTAMALSALVKYRAQGEVVEALERGVRCLSLMQDGSGGFFSYGNANSGSCAQVVIALCELGIEQGDPRFVKNGKTALDALMSYSREGGGFAQIEGGAVDSMASEQALCALAAYLRFCDGQSSFYRMNQGAGLVGRHPEVIVPEASLQGAAFEDTSDDTAIEALAARGIVKGVDGRRFLPDRTVTRAELAAMIVRALGLPEASLEGFIDVPK